MQLINLYLRDQLAAIDWIAQLERAPFQFWHVEPLLNQAADLLDRCLEDYTLERSLEERFAHIHIDYQERTKRLLLEESRLIDHATHKRDTQVLEVQRDAYGRIGNSIHDKTTASDQLVARNLPAATGEYDRTKIQQYDAHIYEMIAGLERTVRDLELEWTTQDANDQETSYNDRKSILSTLRQDIETPDGALNLLSLRDKVKERIFNDFRQGAVRLQVAQKGLEDIYNYTEPLPRLRVGDDDALPLEPTVKWVRDAIAWLVGFQQYDQAFSRCVSLRAIVTDDKWPDNADEWLHDGASFRFEVPPRLFAGHRHVRLRGITASVVGAKTGFTPWRVTIKIPARARFVREMGTHEFDQTFPPCHLGRVDRWDASREPEVCGTFSLMNGSPFGVGGEDGEWEITIEAPDHAGDNKPELDDLQLQFVLVGQPI